MNYLKKKIKTTTGGVNNNNNNNNKEKDLEDDLYDEYVVEAPPHPSELIALGVDPNEIDINDPDKLRELYKKAKEEGKDKQVNSVLLAKQRQKEEIEEKKKTKEEWKFFDSITARVEQAVKESQKTLDQLKETSTVEKLTQPEYELRLTADEVFKSSKTVKQEKSADNWIDFGEGTGLVMSTDQQKQEESDNNNNNRRSSDLARNPFAAGQRKADGQERLYHRNMASFEAASLHLEQQQQQQQENAASSATLLNDIIDGGASQMQTDLIAKMTADFQSAIETNDKQYSSDMVPNVNTLNPFENFDPFETIVDDDISFPSPTTIGDQMTGKGTNGSKTTTTNPADVSVVANGDRPAGFFNPFETVIDKDALSSPIEDDAQSAERDGENNKQCYNNNTSDQEASYRINYDNDDQNEDFLGVAPGSKVPNPTPVHRGKNSSGLPGLDLENNDNNNIQEDSSKQQATSKVEESTSIESVIENSSIKERNGDKGKGREKETSKESPLNNNTTNDESDSKNKPQLLESSNKNSNSNGRFKSPPDYCALPRPKPIARPQAENVPTIQQAILTTPARKRHQQQQQRKKASFQEDSSDSSEDDDRIQIVIRAREPPKSADHGENNSSGDGGESGEKQQQPQPVLVPLLPPPPSRSTMKHCRERGQVEDMPSPVMSYKSRANNSTNNNNNKKKIDSFEDLPIGVEESSNTRNDNDSGKETAQEEVKAKGSEEEPKVDVDDDDDDDDDDERGRFVIPMPHSDDEDGDNYTGKPDSPLFDDDTSYVLEEFPTKYNGPGWEMMLRYPPKKKLTSNRFWKKIFVKLAEVPDVTSATTSGKKQSTDQQQQQAPSSCIALQIFDKASDKKPMQEIPIQATYTVSEISSQQFDQFGKIFTIKLQYIFYKERVGVRQGQLARFIHSGHIGASTTSGGHGVDPISIGAIKRIGAPIEHSPQVSQIIKLGCISYNDIKQFKNCLEDSLFKMPIHRDRALSQYKTEEVQMAVRDETYIELNHIGQIIKQLARVRLFFLSFLNGMPYVEVGINDIHRQGREVVGRMDILPVVTEEWIRLEACELHSTVDVDEFEKPDSRMIKLLPPDGTFFELMRFRVRPPRNRELPLQITANMSVTRTKVSINCEVMVPGCVSRKHGQIPCENIAIRIHIPDCWIYFFREEKHFRMGSKKSVNRRPGKVKGIERFLGGGGGLQDINDDSSLIEVTSGQAKYEHHHNSIVWRAARWPKESQSAYVQNTMKIRLPLTAYDKMPENFYEYVHVEYTMPATTVSHTTLRSISVNPCDDEPPEKYVKYSAKYEYRVKMRLSVNLTTGAGGTKAALATDGDALPESSPIVIMKQPDLDGDLQREQDSNDDSDDDDDDEQDGRNKEEVDHQEQQQLKQKQLEAEG